MNPDIENLIEKFTVLPRGHRPGRKPGRTLARHHKLKQRLVDGADPFNQRDKLNMPGACLKQKFIDFSRIRDVMRPDHRQGIKGDAVLFKQR
ncbi:hypothetical protein D3C80_991830 [compost metagenome]